MGITGEQLLQLFAEYNIKEGISPQLAAGLSTKSVPQGEIL